MPEAGNEVIRRSRVPIDSYGGATAEVGNIVQLLASGVLTRDAIVTNPTN
jgi:ornithine cyclodeaminase